jgi:hypothetical protein
MVWHHRRVQPSRQTAGTLSAKCCPTYDDLKLRRWHE